MATGSSPESLPDIGRQISHYLVLDEIGRGGMGVVYSAHDQRLSREVALKTPLSLDRDSVHRFLREARFASQLSSPYIVPLYEVFEDGDRPWISMELIQGGSLRNRLKEHGALPVQDVVRWGLHLTEALAIAHQQGLLHRDVNPKNVLFDEQGRARLTDFGLVKALDGPATPADITKSLPLTGTGAVVGTPGYMSPEQLLGHELHPTSDLFSLGVTLYEMCAGQPAFQRTERGEIIDAVLHGEPTPLSRLSYQVPDELERIIRKAIVKNAEERYQHAAELHADLLALQRKLDYESYGVSHPASRIALPRWRRIGHLLTTVALGLALAVIVWFVSTRQGEDALHPGEARQVALVTWPSEERNSRLSPDGHWYSFVSDRDGARAIWIGTLGRGEPRRLEVPSGSVLEHVWSEDGLEIAVLLKGDGKDRIAVVPAPMGGWPRLQSEVPEGARLARWVGASLFLEFAGDHGLWSWNAADGSLAQAWDTTEPFDYCRDYDVRPDGTMLSFVGVREGREDLWGATLPDGSPTRLTTGDFAVFGPRWTTNNELVFRSTRTGSGDLWKLDLENLQTQALPFSQSVDRVDDVAAGGALLTLGIVDERADLWHYEAHTGLHTQLTADTLGDFGASAATNLLCFTRTKSGPGLGDTFLDGRIFQAKSEGARLSDLHLIIEHGIHPLLSPNGRWLAFLRVTQNAPYFTDLWVKDLRTQRENLVSSTFQQTGHTGFPAEFLGRCVLWGPDDATLYFVQASGDFQPELTRVSVGPENDGPMVLFQGVARSQFRDLARHGSSGHLTWVQWQPSQSSWQILTLNVATGAQQVLLSETLEWGGELSAAGWWHERLVALRSTVNTDDTQRTDVLLVSANPHETTMLRTVDSCFVHTARLDPDSGRLYLTVVEERTHGLISIDLETGEIRPITPNDLPGVTYSGITFLGDDGVVYSRSQRNSDLWLLDSR